MQWKFTGTTVALSLGTALSCEPKSSVVRDVQTVYVDREVPVYINCAKDPDQDGCSSVGSDGVTKDIAGGSNSDGSSDDSTSGSGTDTVVTTDTSTAVSMSGSLALASGGATGMGLTQTSSYFLKCVTLDLSDLKSCIGEIDAEGAFDITCDGFRGKPFGCFILEGASGTTDDTALSIVGTLTSSDLVIGNETTDVAMNISFDPSTGAAAVAGVSQKVIKDDGSELAVDASSLTKTLPSALTNLSIATGVYDMCFQPVQNTADALKGNVTAQQAGQCSGFMETNYVAFSASSGTELPTMEIWRSKTDYDSCHDLLGNVRFQLSDGTNSLQFTKANVSYDTLLAAIIDNTWAPQAAIDQYEASKMASSQKGPDPMIAELRDNVFHLASGADVCPSLIDALVMGYSGATTFDDKGVKKCDRSTITYSPAELNTMFAQDGPPPQWCDEYRAAADSSTRNTVKARFLGECKAHLEGAGGQDIWAGQSLVWSFLENISQIRHQNSNQRGQDLKIAFRKFDEAVKGVDCNSDTTPDFPNGMETLSVNKALLNSCANLDSAIRALAKVWKDTEWDFQVRDGLKCIENASDLSATAISTCAGLNFSAQPTLTVRGFFTLIFLDTRNPFCSGCNQMEFANGKAFLQQQVCFASGNNELDLTSVNSTGKPFIGTFMSSLVAAPQNMGYAWPQGLTVQQKKDNWTSMIDGLVTNHQVSGCSELSLKRMKADIVTYMDGSLQANPADDRINQVAWTFSQFLVNYDLNAIDTHNPDGSTGDPLATNIDLTTANTKASAQLPVLAQKLALLAGKFPQNYVWMFDQVCRTIPAGTVAGWTIPFGQLADISCTDQVPTQYRQMMGQCQDPAAPCPFSTYDSNPGWQARDRFANLARMVNEEKGRNAFRSDAVYLAKKQAILDNSQCLPDASLGRSPVVDADGNLTFDVIVRAPVRQKLAGPVDLDVTTLGSGTTKFAVESSNLQTQDGGMSGDACYWGEVQKLHKIVYDSGASQLTGVFTQAFVDTCHGDSSDSTDSSHAWHNTVSATKVSD